MEMTEVDKNKPNPNTQLGDIMVRNFFTESCKTRYRKSQMAPVQVQYIKKP